VGHPLRASWQPHFQTLCDAPQSREFRFGRPPAALFPCIARTGLLVPKEGIRVGWMLMFAEAFFIIFNHVILTPAIKRKLAPEKRRSKLPPSNKRAFHRG
jgi:hypothetical protein